MSTLKQKMRKMMRAGKGFSHDVTAGVKTINNAVVKVLPFMKEGGKVKFKTDKKHGHAFNKRWTKGELAFIKVVSK